MTNLLYIKSPLVWGGFFFPSVPSAKAAVRLVPATDASFPNVKGRLDYPGEGEGVGLERRAKPDGESEISQTCDFPPPLEKKKTVPRL